jgi:hypothetical protein
MATIVTNAVIARTKALSMSPVRLASRDTAKAIAVKPTLVTTVVRRIVVLWAATALLWVIGVTLIIGRILD